MDRLNRILAHYPWLARCAWGAMLLVLAACNDGGDGGGPGY